MAMTAVSAGALTDAWNTRRPEAVAALYAPDGIRCVMAHPGPRVEGMEAIADHVREIMRSCPDCTLENRSEGTLRGHPRRVRADDRTHRCSGRADLR